MPHHHTNWLIFALIGAIALVLGASAYVHMRKQRLTARAVAIATLRSQLEQLNDLVSALTPLRTPHALRALLGLHQQGLSAELARLGISTPSPTDAAVEGAVTALASPHALTRVVQDLTRTQAYLLELEKIGRVSRIDRHALSEAVTHLEVLVQTESLTTWAELPGTSPARAVEYLREAQALLAGARHLDNSFATRIALLRTHEAAIGLATAS